MLEKNDDDQDAILATLEEEGLRLDKFLINRFPLYSRQYFQYLIQENLVLVNGQLVKKSYLLREGDEVEVEFAATEEIALEAEDIPLNILFEDEAILVVNKPVGMVVHPAVGNWSHTFVNALLFHCKQLEKGETLRPGIVHRLDKDTSGVLIAAKNERVQKKLVEAFASRLIEKTYLAVCIGNPGSKTVNKKIGRHPTKRKEMAIVEEKGKEAITQVNTLSYNDQLSIVKLFPKTGRTHQLRVHLKAVGCPILGDALYGNPSFNKKWKADRQLLHAYSLRFHHPVTNEEIEVKAPIPEDMQNFIKMITKNENFDPKG